ncbi:MAG: type II toxin-antitoxin system ParD family antitoxin [Beutenbergiaceae bacterium]
MTGGSHFTISAINVARAAIRQTERAISTDAPVDIKVRNYGSDGSSRVYIEVSSPAGKAQRVDVDDSEISACLAEQDSSSSRRKVSGLVDRLAGEIEAAVRVQVTCEGGGSGSATVSREAPEAQTATLRAALLAGEASGAPEEFSFDVFAAAKKA